MVLPRYVGRREYRTYIGLALLALSISSASLLSLYRISSQVATNESSIATLLDSDSQMQAGLDRINRQTAIEQHQSLSLARSAANDTELALDRSTNELLSKQNGLVRDQQELESRVQALKSSVAVIRSDLFASSADVTRLRFNAATLSSELQLASAQTAQSADTQQQELALTEQVASQLYSGPVYNAIYQKPLKDGKVYFTPGQPTSVRFYIGSPSLINALSPSGQVPDKRLQLSKGDIPLNILFICKVCTAGGYQSKALVYHSELLTSDTAEFDFTPGAELVAKTSGEIIVSFIVEGAGFIYDQIPLTMYADTVKSIEVAAPGLATPSLLVGNEPTPSAAAPPPNISIIKSVAPPTDYGNSLADFKPVDKKARAADLVVSLILDHSTNHIKVQFTVENEDLKSKLASYLVDGKSEIFDRDYSAAQLEVQAENVAIASQLIVDSKNRALLGLLQSGKKGQAALQVLEGIDVKLDPDQQSMVLEKFRNEGDYLYTELFYDPSDSDLAHMADILESFRLSQTAKRPLRILIVASDLVFPWQFLHRIDTSSVDDFWGYKYELITIPVSDKAFPGRGDAHLSLNNTLGSVFATYTAADDAPPSEYSVSAYALQQMQHFSGRIPVQNADFHNAKSSSDFVDSLTSFANHLQYLMVYSHGANGYDIDASGHIQIDALGLRLLFSATPGDFVTPQKIDQIRKGASRFLTDEPIVFLNTCNSGNASVFLSYGALTFPIAFIRLGASGVIATEAPMWDTFAYRFGNDLIDSIAGGDPLSLALFNVRRKYLDSGNPLGLFYSYYGGGSVTVDKDE